MTPTPVTYSPDDLERALDGALLGLMMHKGSMFLSSLFCHLKIIWSETDLPTAGTDGETLWINPQFFMPLSKDMRVTLLAHELWHCGFLHMERGEGHDHQLFNMAADHAINLMLKEHGYVFDVPHLADPRFTSMSTEEIYNILKQENPSIELPFGSDIVPCPPEPKKSGGQDGQPQQGSVGLTVAQQNLIRAVTVARMSPGTDAGHLPGELSTLVDKLLNPKLPWQAIVRRFFNDLGQASWSWRRPNKRYSRMYLPSLLPREDGLDHIVWAIDSSGSLEDWQLQEANTEIAHVHRTFQPQQMTVFSFDTKIQDTWTFAPHDRFQALEIHGRGGTDLCDLWARVTAMRPAPSALVVFTDLEVGIPPPPGKIPVIWIDNSERGSRKPPYGTYVKMDR